MPIWNGHATDPPGTDLRDLVDMILGTGCRLGEASGQLYDDIDLNAAAPSIVVTRTVTNAPGRGTFRQPWPKIKAGWRWLYLPPFTVEILLRRTVENPPNTMGAVFPTRVGT